MAKKPAVKKVNRKEAIAHVFGTATTATTTTKAKKSTASEEFSEGFQNYVALLIIEKAIGGVKKQLEGQYKEEAYSLFIEEVAANERKPDSIKAEYEDATATFQFKKRSQGFSSAVVEQLNEYDITYVSEETIPERYVINPEILDDQTKLGKLAEAIMSLNLGFDVIQKQNPQFKYNISSDTFKHIAKVKDPEVLAELVKAVSTVAVSHAKLSGEADDIEAAFKILTESGLL
jgi:hypothetical protein